MDVVYSSTVLTEADRYSIGLSWICALTGKYNPLSRYGHLMDESLIWESIDDTIECREIHMTTHDESLLEIWEGDSRRLLELLYEATTRHSDTRSRHDRVRDEGIRYLEKRKTEKKYSEIFYKCKSLRWYFSLSNSPSKNSVPRETEWWGNVCISTSRIPPEAPWIYHLLAL